MNHRLAFLVLTVLATSGCLPAPYERHMSESAARSAGLSTYRHPALSGMRRIVSLPPILGATVGRSAVVFGEMLPVSFRELGVFEVLPLPEAERQRLLIQDPLASGSVDAAVLRELHSRYRADGLLIARIEQFQSFDPVAVGLELSLVSCRDGQVAWSASGNFDAGRKAIQEDVHSWYHGTNGDGLESLADWRGVLQSPRLFARYVSDRLAATLADDAQAPTPAKTSVPTRPHLPGKAE